ncbi:MAG: PTS sugar transporter subunit IIA [Selenomonadaceae bacterium]
MDKIFAANTITLDIKAKNKEQVIDEMIDLLAKDGVLTDAALYKAAIYERENLSTTGIGFGIAIPHAKTSAVKTARVAVGIAKEGVDYGSDDGEKVQLLFMIAAQNTDDNLHLQTLAKLSRKLIDPVFRNRLLNSDDKEDVLSVLSEI